MGTGAVGAQDGVGAEQHDTFDWGLGWIVRRCGHAVGLDVDAPTATLARCV
ncbi:hypothetical protein LINBF2_13160 [Limnohabitans sp. INBF002]|nr:hypothetical protein LINBF2_13160 [Limnohabitans sp. INBF002]